MEKSRYRIRPITDGFAVYGGKGRVTTYVRVENGCSMNIFTKRGAYRYDAQRAVPALNYYHLSRAVAEKADHLTATDLSDEMLAVAQARLMDLPNVTVKKADCKRTGLPSDMYDSVVMINLIHVINEPERAIQESHRLLKNGKIVHALLRVSGKRLRRGY